MTTQSNGQVVTSIAHLRDLIASGTTRFFIVLAGGPFRSTKTITLTRTGRFKILNHIDDTRQTLTEDELFTHSNIGEAITKKCLIAERMKHP